MESRSTHGKCKCKNWTFSCEFRYFKTLFSLPGNSTSSEISDEEQVEMGLSKGIIRLSIGLDEDIKHTFKKMKDCLKAKVY